MPVYNAGDFLVESIESILNQTYKNYEFIIVDDASTDNSWEILKRFKSRSKKIKIYRFKKNKGVSATVKYAISKVKGEFIARMDADDIAVTNRLDKQLSYLKSHKQTVAVGGQCVVIDKSGNKIGEKRFPTGFKEIYDYIFKFIPLQQPTLMIARNRVPRDFIYYLDGMNTAEEVGLLFKLFQYGKVENLADFVLFYRVHGKNTSLSHLKTTYLLTLYSRLLAVIKYNYRPKLDGILVTLLQTMVVLILPTSWTLKLYSMMKNWHAKKSEERQNVVPSFKLGHEKL